MLDQSPDRLAYGLREFCRLAGFGVTFAYREIAAGRLKVKKAGRSTVVLAADAAAYLAGLPEGVFREPESARQGRAARIRRGAA